MNIILQVLLAWVYSHVLEYILHKYFLHNADRKKLFKPHFGDHHKTAKKNGMVDSKYVGKFDIVKDPEIKGLLLLALLHLPVCIYFPISYGVLILSTISYYVVHRLTHRNIYWARKYTPWHYDHHMAQNQHSNWGVRLPIIDIILKTRKNYKDSEREKREFKRMKMQDKLKKIRLVRGDE